MINNMSNEWSDDRRQNHLMLCSKWVPFCVLEVCTPLDIAYCLPNKIKQMLHEICLFETTCVNWQVLLCVRDVPIMLA